MQLKAHLEAVLLPEGVHAYPVQRVGWLHATIVCPTARLEIGRQGNCTDYVLLLTDGLKFAEKWEKERRHLTDDDML